MTNFEAVRAEIAPFTADKLSIEKALIDSEMDSEGIYNRTDCKSIAKVSIQILTSFLALSSEGEGSFSQSYDKAGLLTKITVLAKSNGLEDMLSSVGSTIMNGSMYW